jgi:hypothetical protein
MINKFKIGYILSKKVLTLWRSSMIKLKGTHKYQESIIRILINQQFGLSAYKYVKLELVNPLLKMIDESDNGSTWMR